MQARNLDLEAEIDLRDLIRPLLRHKWWIIGVTVGMAVIAFLISEFMIQKQYVAVSSVVFTTPAFNAVLDPRIVQTTQLPPDYRAMSDVVMADDLLGKVYQSEEMSAERKKGITFGKFKQKFAVTLSGTSQLLLQVTDSDPQLAAQAANLWAQNATARLNRLYGSSDATLTALGQQVDSARQEWASSEKALLDYLPQSQTDSLNAQLSQAQISYNAQLGRIHSLDLLLSDGHALDARWSAQAPDLPLGAGDGISLLTLQQRANEVLLCNQQAAASVSAYPDAATGSSATSSQALDCIASNGLNGLQLQLSGSDLAAGVATVGNARQALKAFLDGLQSQQSDLQNGLGTLEEQLTGLRAKLEFSTVPGGTAYPGPRSGGEHLSCAGQPVCQHTH